MQPRLTSNEDIYNGVYRQLFVAAEQLGATGGHITRFAKYTWDATFLNRISILNIDEAHYIQNSGLPIGKVPAFRPAWGKLYDLRVRLPHGIPVALFSASMAPNVLQTVMENMRISQDAVIIKLSTNRPNITLAVLPLVGSIKNFSNLDFIIPQPYPPSMPPIEKGIIFIDDKLATSNLAEYLNDRCPEALRISRPFRHFHSGMSEEYLLQTYDEFEKLDSACRVLVATCGASMVRPHLSIKTNPSYIALGCGCSKCDPYILSWDP
jgi:superfamily II DNA helicase RecQ